MQKLCFLLIVLASTIPCSRAQTGIVDPVSDFLVRHRDDLRGDDDKHEHVIKIEIDTQGLGRKDVLLSTEKSGRCSSDQYGNSVYTWDLYRNLGDGRYVFFSSKRIETAPGVMSNLDGQTIELDPSKVYVGQIEEIGVYGIIATQYLPKHNAASLSVFVFHEDFFEELGFPHSDQPSAIYHRDGQNKILDLPSSYQHYLSAAPLPVTILQDAF